MTKADEPLDARYFYWLYSLIGSETNKNPARTYWQLAEQLFRTEFTWFVPNDDNRVEDGKDLRVEFCESQDEFAPREFFDEGCSMLEMLIALSRRAAFEASGEPYEWFWIILNNLNLRGFTDDVYSDGVRDGVDLVLDTVNRRDYSPDGSGGLFPLRHPKRDQRKVEIWYQLSAYLLERSEL